MNVVSVSKGSIAVFHKTKFISGTKTNSISVGFVLDSAAVTSQSSSEEKFILDYLENSSPPVTRELLEQEMEQLRASGAFSKATSLRGKFGTVESDLTFEQIEEALKDINAHKGLFGDDSDK
jgi:hypothetical protein